MPDKKVGLRISFACGPMPDVSFYGEDILSIRPTKNGEQIMVKTIHGFNIYNMIHIIGIVMDHKTMQDKYKVP